MKTLIASVAVWCTLGAVVGVVVRACGILWCLNHLVVPFFSRMAR